MKSQFYSPSPRCSALIHYYVIMKSEEGLESVSDKYIPDGTAAIVFNFISEEKFITGDEKYKLPDHFLVVPNLVSLRFESQSLFDSIIVKCKASVAARLFNTHMIRNSGFPHLNIDLFRGFPMFDTLNEFKSTEERINFFENYLIENIIPADYIPDEIDIAYDRIINSNGDIKIHNFMNDIKMNPRTFRRNFLQRVGISAKELLRIVRVNHIWGLCKDPGKINFYNIVYQSSFFDQSHFINDFKKIVGETPREFFKRELDQVEFISGRPS